jgi:hypothetical protein
VKLISEMVLAVTVATEQLLTNVILNEVEMYYPVATVPVRMIFTSPTSGLLVLAIVKVFKLELKVMVVGKEAKLERVAVYVKAVSEHVGETVNSEKVMVEVPELIT